MANGNGTNPFSYQPPAAGAVQPQLSSGDLNDQINALISSRNVIQMPDTPPDPSDTGALAQYQAMTLAKSMQDAGTPMTREQFRTAVASQYGALQKQQIEEAQKVFEAKLSVQTEALKQALPRNLDATNADQLASYADSSDALDELGKLHQAAVDKGHFGNYVTAAIPGYQASQPDAVEFNSYRDTILGKVARGIGGDTRVDNKDLDIARNFLPNLGDSPDVAKAKIAILQSHIAGVMKRQLQFYQANGFKVQPMIDGPYAALQAKADAQMQKLNNAPGPDLASQSAAHQNTASRLTAATSRLAQANAAAATQQAQLVQPQPSQVIQPQLQQPQ